MSTEYLRLSLLSVNGVQSAWLILLAEMSRDVSHEMDDAKISHWEEDKLISRQQEQSRKDPSSPPFLTAYERREWPQSLEAQRMAAAAAQSRVRGWLTLPRALQVESPRV